MRWRGVGLLLDMSIYRRYSRNSELARQSWGMSDLVRLTETFLALIASGYDALLMSQREYAEDTVFKSLVSSTTTFSARRRTVYLFHSSNVTETGVANPSIWIDNTAAVWDSLNATLTKINPNRIAINIDPDLAFSDGLVS